MPGTSEKKHQESILAAINERNLKTPQRVFDGPPTFAVFNSDGTIHRAFYTIEDAQDWMTKQNIKEMNEGKVLKKKRKSKSKPKPKPKRKSKSKPKPKRKSKSKSRK